VGAHEVRTWIAAIAAGNRSMEIIVYEPVRGIRVPTLVVHGDSDPLINVEAGRRTAQLIGDAELLIVPGMGHDLPRPVWPTLADALCALADRAEWSE
jgi:pimeloyl-ACP methyl ester carboxylesterase